jgi:UDP-glucose 4-epimerase
MKILVTGGAGFVGTNLIQLLKKSNNDEIYSIDNYSIGSKINHIDGVEYLEDDIINIQNYHNNFDVIYHLAALSRIQPSFSNPDLIFDSNTKGTLKVLEFAKKNNSKLIYSGSSSMHHDPSLSPYAMTKYLGEQLCKLYKVSFDLEVDIVRFYNVYGPYEIIEGEWAAVIGKWRNQIRKGLPITIVGDGNQRRDFTHISDIVDGLVKIKNKKSKKYIWELGSGKNYSINEVYEIFKKKFNCKCIYVEDQKGNYKETLRDNDDALNELGWNPTGSLEEYILSL